MNEINDLLFLYGLPDFFVMISCFIREGLSSRRDMGSGNLIYL